MLLVYTILHLLVSAILWELWPEIFGKRTVITYLAVLSGPSSILIVGIAATVLLTIGYITFLFTPISAPPWGITGDD